MATRIPVTLICFLATLLQAGCSIHLATTIPVESMADSTIPLAAPELEHITARIPVSQAATASMAQAMAHVALGEARIKTDQMPCGGSILSGQPADQLGPLAILDSGADPGNPVWYYRISYRPAPDTCPPDNRTAQYHAMQNSLPGWIRLIPPEPPAAVGMLQVAH